jgi:hypothetical protein
MLDGQRDLLMVSATMSSTLNPHFASNCIDRDDGPSSMCHSAEETSPWISFKMPVNHGITKIVIFNRYDCCWHRLVRTDRSFSLENTAVATIQALGQQHPLSVAAAAAAAADPVIGFQIWVGHSPGDYASNTSVQCDAALTNSTTIPAGPAGRGPFHYDCPPALTGGSDVSPLGFANERKYVTLVLPGASRVINLAGVHVYSRFLPPSPPPPSPPPPSPPPSPPPPSPPRRPCPRRSRGGRRG